MKNRATEDHKVWLFDLAHGNLTEENVLKGFIKYYVLNGFTVGNVQDDIVFRTHYDPVEGMKTLNVVLQKVAEGVL